MSYTPVGWKDYPEKTTPTSADNLKRMEKGIIDAHDAIGDLDEIADIGDGTLAGAIAEQNNALDGKQGTITGAASTVTDSNLTANRALVSNADGKVAVSAVTATELGYLDGLKSNAQTQLDAKLPLSGGTLTGGVLSKSIGPTDNVTWNLGSSTNAYASVNARYFYAYDTNANPYARLFAHTEGTTSQCH